MVTLQDQVLKLQAETAAKDEKIRAQQSELADCQSTLRQFPPWMPEENKVQKRLIDNLEAQVRRLESECKELTHDKAMLQRELDHPKRGRKVEDVAASATTY